MKKRAYCVPLCRKSRILTDISGDLLVSGDPLNSLQSIPLVSLWMPIASNIFLYSVWWRWSIVYDTYFNQKVIEWAIVSGDNPYKPSPVTYSPWLILLLGTSFDFKRASKRFTPSRNFGFSLSLLLLICCIISSSSEGGGRLKLSNPEKKLRMLSATFSWFSFTTSLKT